MQIEQNTITTPFTATEAQYVLLLIAGQAVQPVDPQTGELNLQGRGTFDMLQSIATKCHTIIRTTQPLASAARRDPANDRLEEPNEASAAN